LVSLFLPRYVFSVDASCFILHPLAAAAAASPFLQKFKRTDKLLCVAAASLSHKERARVAAFLKKEEQAPPLSPASFLHLSASF
jgi:hypothetical protein